MTTPTMKFALFGATGPTGQEILRQGLERGHSISALVRTPSKLKISANLLNVVEGDVLDPQAVKATLLGCEGVIVTLGGKMSDKKRALTIGTTNIVECMKTTGLARLVVVTSVGVGDSRGEAGFFFERIIVPLFLRAEFADKNSQEAVVRASGLDFVIVRPGQLTNEPAKGIYQAAPHLPAGKAPKITRADVAHFCLEQLTSDRWLSASVSLTNS
jgi:uncharacterized protein YbjT (DUF2867 family)